MSRHSLTSIVIAAAVVLGGGGAAIGHFTDGFDFGDLLGSGTSKTVKCSAKAEDSYCSKKVQKITAKDIDTVKSAAKDTKYNVTEGYKREKDFGADWAYDFNHNGCDTRDDVLARDMTKVKYTSGHCTVASGTLDDPYTGKTIHFKRGKGTSLAVQIDHAVPLANVWVSGAKDWTGSAGQTKREKIANDPLQLIAADGPANEAKGAKSAYEWMPENKAFRCTYAKTQIAVKIKYGLTAGPKEKAAWKSALKACK